MLQQLLGQNRLFLLELMPLKWELVLPSIPSGTSLSVSISSPCIYLFASFIENLLFGGAVALFLLTLYWGYLKYRKVEGLGLGDIILLSSLSLYLGFPYALYLITISASLLLLKIIASRRYQERHAFGSWIVLTFGAFILFQEFYEFVG